MFLLITVFPLGVTIFPTINRGAYLKTTMIRYSEIKSKLFDAEIWRVFISGSSSAGKTYFAKKLLANKFFNYERIYYYHPDIAEEFPVDWNSLKKPVIFQAGIPSRKELLDTPNNSCIILDDLFTEACKSKDISYLFRVLSSKKKIHVIIMTQRYFAEAGLDIRNSSNFHVLILVLPVLCKMDDTIASTSSTQL